MRSANQDAYFIDNPNGRFFIVADGMGGHAGGEEASRIATETICEFLDSCWGGELEPPELLEKAFILANENILKNQQSHPARADMGTTAVVVIFPEDGQPWCAHVGDSRLYRFGTSGLEQITEDHTWVAQAVRAGILTPDQSRLHPWRHVLAQCLGREELNQIDVQPFTIQSGDALLLCSDGLTEEVADTVIAQQLHLAESCEEAVDALVEEAKNNGGQDNITVVTIAIDVMPSLLIEQDDATSPELTLNEISE